MRIWLIFWVLLMLFCSGVDDSPSSSSSSSHLIRLRSPRGFLSSYWGSRGSSFLTVAMVMFPFLFFSFSLFRFTDGMEGSFLRV